MGQIPRSTERILVIIIIIIIVIIIITWSTESSFSCTDIKLKN